MILVEDSDFENNLGLDLHIRTTIRRGWSFISETALKIGKDILEVRGGGEFTFNGHDNVLPPGASIGSFSVMRAEHVAKTRLKISNPPKTVIFTVGLGQQGMIEIKVYNEFLAVFVKDAQKNEFDNSVGLMGQFRDGAKLARDGVTTIDDNIAFGMEWQVRDTDPQLFTTAKGPQFPVKCRMPDAAQKMSLRRRRLDEIGISWEEAEKACSSWPEEGRDSCMYDVLSTGDLEMAEAGAM